MPTITVPATVSFGFIGSPDYLMLDTASRTTVKYNVKSEISILGNILPDTIDIDVDSTTYSADDWYLEGEINDYLAGIGGYAFYRTNLTAIEYIWNGNDRYCVHSYLMSIDDGFGLQPWMVPHSATDPNSPCEHICFMLSWSSPDPL